MIFKTIAITLNLLWLAMLLYTVIFVPEKQGKSWNFFFTFLVCTLLLNLLELLK